MLHISNTKTLKTKAFLHDAEIQLLGLCWTNSENPFMNRFASKTILTTKESIYTMKKQIITIIASLFLFASANAIEFGVGVSGGLATVNAEGSESETTNTGAEASIRNKSVDNAMFGMGSVFAEVIFGNGLTFGIEHVPMTADVSDATHKRTDTAIAAAGEGTVGTIVRQAKAEVENFNTIYTEIPIYGMYLKAGLSSIDVNVNETAQTDGGSYKNKQLDGVTYGIGIKGEWKGFYTKLGGERTDFDTYKDTSGTTNSVSADLDVTSLKFSIGKAF